MNIFIHYLDQEILDMNSANSFTPAFVNKIIFSIKLAILLTDDGEYVYIPVSNYFESHLAWTVLEEFRELKDCDLIKFSSSSKNIESFLKKKKIVHPIRFSEKEIYEKEQKIYENHVPGRWTVRGKSATDDIITKWDENIDSSVWGDLYKLSKYTKPSHLENVLSAIPVKMKNKAFVVEYVTPFLEIKEGNEQEAKDFINIMISKSYIESFLKEYEAVCFSNFSMIQQADIILPEGYNHINYARLCRELACTKWKNDKSLYKYIDECDSFDLLMLKNEYVIQEIMNKYKVESVIPIIFRNKEEAFLMNGNTAIKKKERKKMKTFIVHGHDELEKLKLKNYLQNVLKMDEPIILSEKASGGLTVIEKFEKFAVDTNLVFVLLTPDDKCFDETKAGERTRQNVIFEMGYFLGKLGRKSGRVILLHKGKLDLPNDISGIVYIKIDDGIEAAGEQIRREIIELEK